MDGDKFSMVQRAAGVLTLILGIAAVSTFLVDIGTYWSARILIAAMVSSFFLAMFSLIPQNRSGRVAPAIHHQLVGIGEHPEKLMQTLQPVLQTDAPSNGWNEIVQTVQAGAALQLLESRIDQKLGSRNGADDSTVLHCLAEGIAVTDIEGRMTFVNRALEAILSTDGDQLLEEQLLEFLPPNLPEHVQQAVTKPQPLSFESNTSSDLGENYLRWTRRPSIDDRGETVGHVWTIRDVTQQKLAEKMREEFVSMATHELRTPLANISAYAETLAVTDEIDVEQQKQFYNIILTESTRLSRFVDELLDISRMEAGSMSIDKRETDLERLLQEIGAKVRPEMQRKQIDFTISLPPKLPSMTIDKDSVSAALVNLLGNACKYTPEGGEVVFTVAMEDQEIFFNVQDTGIGISAEEVPRVFEKFFRSDDSRVRDVTGTGLGLAFTHEVARLHGGRIDVSSELGEGSTFSFVLPVNNGGKR
ncbi:sensor histidine kinase [Rubinisphaera margarita]|uniref:sensor histidine kinase n=1 Tax=Rubinisphaera margarita TaxID=2909586 RepID=UPI001EE7BA5E|nr:ATP-binding protein [Rubinisphaera margarita]MCG6155838.1 ATP-binding protein [Rubinisphaera margarita]